jgi:alpha-methylacyl-CoA racemase
VADLAGGLLAALSIMAATVGRERGQGGRYLDVAMLDAVMSWMLPIAGSFLFSQGSIPARGRLPLSGGLPSYHIYQTADDQWVTFAALEPTLWADFCAAVSRPDLNPRQFDPDAIADMAALFREKSRADWLAAFQGKDICVEPVGTFAEAWRDPQVLHRGLAQPGAEPLSTIGPVFQFAAPEHAGPAPALGQHTRAVLQQAGLTEAEVQALEAAGIAKSTL